MDEEQIQREVAETEAAEWLKDHDLTPETAAEWLKRPAREPGALPVHSPLGASSAERWMSCPGSVALLKKLDLPESDEPDYRRDGIAAHEAAAHCLTNSMEGWEVIGTKFHDTEITEEIANAVQIYLDTVRPLMAAPDVQVYVEQRVQFPEHKLGYGTVDCGIFDPETCTLSVNDYKHGQGIVVDAEWNPQLLYYAHGLVQLHPETRYIDVRIIQPRAFHPEGPVRKWTISADMLAMWVESDLLPAMNAVEIDNTLDAGPWCRFCPAKLICPVLTSLFGAAAQADPRHIVNLSDENLGRSYQYTQAVKHYLKAFEEETFRRLNLGKDVPGTKLVAKKANRVWKDGGPEVVKARFGADAFTEPEIKTPAQIESLGPEAKKVVSEWAYTPQTGLTVALAADKRPAVKVQTTQEAFGAALSALTASDSSS